MVNLLSGTKTKVFNIGSIKIYTDNTAPTGSIGSKGDLWIDTNTPKLWQKGETSWFSIDAQSTADNVLYVTKNGNDTFDGRSLVSAKRTIKSACAAAQTLLNTATFEAGRALILVAAGVFTEDCPILTPAGVSIIGMDRQATAVKASNPNSNVFQMSSGCHYSNFSVIDHRLSPNAFSITPSGFVGYTTGSPINTAQTGWAFSFAPGAVITESPRIINVYSRSGSGVYGSPSYVAGGGGLLVDSDTISASSTTYQVYTEDFVQVNLGGIAYKAANKGVIQADDGHSSFCQFDALSVDGGHIMLRDSTTAHGNYGLWADGSRILPDTSTFGSIIEASGHTFTYAGSGVDFTKVSEAHGGDGVVDENKFTISRNDGRIFMTGSDERGNFYVGEIVPGVGGADAKPKFRIMQDKDIIDGRTFYQSIFGFMVPMSLLLTRRK